MFDAVMKCQKMQQEIICGECRGKRGKKIKGWRKVFFEMWWKSGERRLKFCGDYHEIRDE